MSTHYRHLSCDERIELQVLLRQGKSFTDIAKQLGRHRSTIYREVKRGAWRPETEHANLRPFLRHKLDTHDSRHPIYLAGKAQQKADARKARSHQPLRMRHDPLVHWVISHLRKGWTPEEISGRLPLEFPFDLRMRVSTESLYAWIYAASQKHRQLWQYLPRGRKRRTRKKGRTPHSQKIQFRMSIRDRPVSVATREEFGHWESDTVLGAHGTGVIHTTVERKSRFFTALKLPHATADHTLAAQLKLYTQLPIGAVRSVTADNGAEFTYHYRLADLTGVPTYFCDPYSAHQRGTNEHFNGRLRKYLPKGTSFENLSQEELDEIVWEINNRPRKVLGWRTPAEMFQELNS